MTESASSLNRCPMHSRGEPEVPASERRPKGSGGFYRIVRQVYGNSLVALDGDEWLADRRLLQPMFSHRNIDNVTVEMIASLTEAFDAFAPRAAQGAPLAINREFKTLTMNTLARCLFGVSLSRNETGKLGPLAVEVFDAMLRRMFLLFLPSVLPLPSELALRRALRSAAPGSASASAFRSSSPSSSWPCFYNVSGHAWREAARSRCTASARRSSRRATS